MPAWICIVRDKQGQPILAANGKETKLWFGSSRFGHADEVIAHVKEFYTAVVPIDAYPEPSPPGILSPVPPKFFQYGILEAVQRELAGDPTPDTRVARQTIQRVRIPRR